MGLWLMSQAAGCTVLYPFDEPDPLEVVGNDAPLPPPDQAPVFSVPIYDTVQSDGARFGAAIAIGHFTQLGRAEIAVGAPGADDGSGAVLLRSVDQAGNETVYLFDAATFLGMRETGGTFGSVLSMGRFDDDGLDDLVIGSPDAERGRVCVIYGEPAGSGQLRIDVLESQTSDAATDVVRRFGRSLACGDFDDDGRSDLVVGESAGAGSVHPGTVWVYRGGATGLDKDHPIEVATGDEIAADSLFGWSVAVGNFVAEGEDVKYPDLAIGAPNMPAADSVGDRYGGVGRVWIFRPVVRRGVVERFEQATVLQPTGDWARYVRSFGWALGVGNFNGDGAGAGPARRAIDELVIGAPNSSIPADGVHDTAPSGRAEREQAGLVCVARNDGQRVASANLLFISQEGLGLSESSDHFGFAVAAGDFNRDGLDDLAVGSPDEQLDAEQGRADSIATPQGAGAIFFRFGASGDGLSGGISVAPRECYDYLATAPTPRSMHAGDRFGSVLVVGDSDDDGDADLIVGAPESDTESVHDAGAIWIGLNETTPVGPLDGLFIGEVGDCDDPVPLSMSLRDRNGAICGHLRLGGDVCVDVDGTEVHVESFVDVVSTVRVGGAIDLHYDIVANGGGVLGTLLISAEVLDDESDMTVRFEFESDETGVIGREPIVLRRQ